MDVFCRGQPLQDVIIVQVVAEQKDFVVHAKETALWELHRGGDTSEEMSEETINNLETLNLINQARDHVKIERLDIKSYSTVVGPHLIQEAQNDKDISIGRITLLCICNLLHT